MEKLKWAGTRARTMAEKAKRTSELGEMHNALCKAFCGMGEACYAGDEAGIRKKREEIEAIQARMNVLAEQIDALRNEKRCIRCGAVQSKENRYCACCGAVLCLKEAEILWPESNEEDARSEDPTAGE